MKHPILYHKDRKGKLWSWEIWTEGASVVVEHGTIDGKKQQSRYTAQATNVGRSNERTPIQQASFEAEAKWRFQVERKYSTTPSDAENFLLLPMLAESIDKKKKLLFEDKSMVKFVPCDIQPKLDGVRCLAVKQDGEISLLSRQGKEWGFVPHIIDQLAWLPEGDCLDGELYIHDPNISFQTITSWCKGTHKQAKPEAIRVEYHVYDYPMVNNDDNWGTWSQRRVKLESIPESANVKSLITYSCESYEDIQKYHSIFVADGYEGAIVRIRKGEYSFGHRSSNLMKVKSFMDDDYEVVGWTTGKQDSREGDCVIWICKDNKSETTFQVRPQGTHDERKELTKIADTLIGSVLKVKYFELTDDGIPRFPVGIGFRAEEDR